MLKCLLYWETEYHWKTEQTPTILIPNMFGIPVLTVNVGKIKRSCQKKILLSFQSNMSPNLLDNYKYMAQENIGTTRPNFYISWAWELEQAGNFKGAEKVITVTI